MGFRSARVGLLALAAWGWSCAIDDRSVGVASLAPGGSPGQAASQVAAPSPNAPSSPAPAGGGGGAPGVVGPAPNAGGSNGSEEPLPPVAAPPAVSGTGGTSVRGRVVDFYLRPVRDVAVRIGPALLTTDEIGAFAVDGVSAPYDVSLLVTSTHFGALARAGYVYEGLTRSDPTLQVYAGLPERDTALTISVPNVDFSSGDRSVLLGFGAADANFASRLDSEATLLGSTGWSGPATIFGAAHALEVLGTGTMPNSYGRQNFANLTVRADEAQSVVIDLDSGTSPPTVTLSGNVASGALGDRKNFVVLSFADRTSLTIVEDDAPTGPFVYAVPSLANASLVVAAAAGLGAPDPYAVTHTSGLLPGSTSVALSVPNPVSLLTPAAGASAAPGDVFSWDGGSPSARTFVWHLQFVGEAYEDLFVITSRTSIAMPTFPDRATWPPNVAASWSVETHGETGTVDALTSITGFLDPFSYGFSSNEGKLNGPARGSGLFTESARRPVTLR